MYGRPKSIMTTIVEIDGRGELLKMEAKTLLDVARCQIGIKEYPPGSNKVLYNTWYYGKEVSGRDYAWCMVFCQWVFDQVGIKLPIRTASCTELMNASKKKGSWVTKSFKPGDLVIFSFTDGKTPSHCGIVEDADRHSIVTIEGNTSLTNNDNGGCVMRRTRYITNTLGAYRYNFEEGIDMTVDEFINKLTPAQAYKIMQKAEEHASKAALPTWARTEGYWQKMIDQKVITVNTPRVNIKRDELVSILGRLGLIK